RMDRGPKIHLLDDPTWTPGVSAATWKRLPGLTDPNLSDMPVAHYQPIVDRLLEAVETGARPGCSLKDGRRAHEVIQGVWQSHVSGNTPAVIPAPNRPHPLASWS